VTPHAERILERVSRSCSLDRVFVAGEESAAIADQLRLRGASIEESRATTLVGATGDLLVAADRALYRAKMAGRNLIAEAQRLRQHEVTRT